MKKKKLFILFLVILLIMGLFVGCIPTTPTNLTDLESERGLNDYDNYTIENVPYKTQGLSPWCLAASAAMVLSYYGRDITVEWIAENIDTGPDGAGSNDMISYLKNVLGYKVENKAINKGLSIEEIIKLLKKDIPVIAIQAASLTDSDRHARVIYGYSNDFNYLYVHNPADATEYYLTYSNFEALSKMISPFWNKSDLCRGIVIQTGGLKVEADVDPKYGTVPLKVHCIGFASGGPIPYTYQWEFGDGNWSEKGTGIEYRNLFHTYTEPRKYNPVLHVEDSNGEKAECKVKDVIVISASPIHNLTKDTYYTTIQSAIYDVDNGDTIEVYPGTYYENINFLGKNFTLRSTKPNKPNVVASTIIDGGGNGSVVTFEGGETAQAVLSGFTIQNGSTIVGGGINVDSASPTITGNTITGNTAEYGGGIFVHGNSSPTISDPTITGNTIIGNTVTGYGAGICVYYSSPTISGNTIQDNTADYYAGGIYMYESSPTITGNTITGNTVTGTSGGGIFVHWNSSPTITSNTITGNTSAGNGGGIFVYDSESSPTITSNTITGNTSAGNGGGIWVYNYSSPTITGNTIEDNTASINGGGIFVYSDSDLLPATDRPTGWGTGRENIPTGDPLVPGESVEYTIAGNEFFGNEHGNPLAYTEGAHVYFMP